MAMKASDIETQVQLSATQVSINRVTNGPDSAQKSTEDTNMNKVNENKRIEKVWFVSKQASE